MSIQWNGFLIFALVMMQYLYCVSHVLCSSGTGEVNRFAVLCAYKIGEVLYFHVLSAQFISFLRLHR